MTTPTVQNCPNLFSEATLKPLSRVVTCVIFCSDEADAYVTGGKSLSGSVSGGNGVTVSVDGILTVDPPLLALPEFLSSFAIEKFRQKL